MSNDPFAQLAPRPSPAAGPPGSLGRISVGLVVVAIVSFAVISGLTLSQGWLKPIKPVAATRILEFSGVGTSERSPVFSAKDGWEIRWHVEGKLDQIVWTDEYGKSDYVIAMHRKPIRNGGGVNVAKGGQYFLQVVGEGSWKIDVYQFASQ